MRHRRKSEWPEVSLIVLGKAKVEVEKDWYTRTVPMIGQFTLKPQSACRS
jgi:hypothetical protein